jgi:hypothetical protein
MKNKPRKRIDLKFEYAEHTKKRFLTNLNLN